VSTRRYLLSKVLQSVLTLAFVLTFNFFLFRGLGDPVAQLLRGHAQLPPSAIQDLQRQLGLDLPLPQQFVHYVSETLHGNLGLAYDGTPVSTVIGERAWPTLLLIGTSTIASIVIGIWIGIRQGWRRGSTFDKGSLGLTLVLYSMPEFWFGLLMIMLFSVTLHLFPTGHMTTPASDYTGLQHYADVLNHLALPFFILTVSYLAQYSLIMRSSLMETLGEDFITTARSKGMRERRILNKHAVPNALLPVFTVTILSLGFVISGAITIELIFSWPGLGNATYEAIRSKDYSMLQGLFLLFSVSVIIANLVADLLYSYLDPRVRAA
jgi:peptide/nickel transport system permease protein